MPKWSVEEALAINPDITLTKERRESIYQSESDLEHYPGCALRTAGRARVKICRHTRTKSHDIPAAYFHVIPARG